ncbi:MAG: hypothetical protein ACOVNL_14605 [Prochlorococcaceae cyanobacterium]|jgi:hypothetical protein
MPYWFSPFPLPGWAVTHLEQKGLDRLPSELPGELQEPVLLLYDTPDRILSTSSISEMALLAGYTALLEFPLGSPRLAVWRMQHLSAQALEDCLSGSSPLDCIAQVPWPVSDPLTALVTGSICRAVPGLLDSYLDLEMQAVLAGGEPDSGYLRRLQGCIESDSLLKGWRSSSVLAEEQLVVFRRQLDENEKALMEACERGELASIQLYQAEEELTTLRKKQEEKEKELAEVREEAELTLLQLHQIQEELEHYFLLSRGQQKLLECYEELEQRSVRLLVNLRRA